MDEKVCMYAQMPLLYKSYLLLFLSEEEWFLRIDSDTSSIGLFNSYFEHCKPRINKTTFFLCYSVQKSLPRTEFWAALIVKVICWVFTRCLFLDFVFIFNYRTTAVYLADRRYDMLPEVLSTQLCSLISEVDRYKMLLSTVVCNAAVVKINTLQRERFLSINSGYKTPECV